MHSATDLARIGVECGCIGVQIGLEMVQKSEVNGGNIYLIGFMGVGKSVVGRQVARSLRLKFIDSDAAIEAAAGRSVGEIFAGEGEASFREKERRFIETGHSDSGMVVSCGGGLPLQPGMRELLLSRGLVICLFASVDTILRRTLGNSKRPLLNVDNPEARVRQLLMEREPFYKSTGVGISTEGRTIQEVVRNVVRIYRRYQRNEHIHPKRLSSDAVQD